MVLLIGGYPILWDEAKTWAQRRWPDMEIYDHEHLAHIIESYHKNHKRNMTCVPVEINKQSYILFTVYSTHDQLSTPRKYRKFREGQDAKDYKKKLFDVPADAELAKNSQFTTIADPFREWTPVSLDSLL